MATSFTSFRDLPEEAYPAENARLLSYASTIPEEERPDLLLGGKSSRSIETYDSLDTLNTLKELKPKFTAGDYALSIFGGPNAGNIIRNRRLEEAFKPVIAEYATKMQKSIAKGDFDSAEKLNNQFAQVPGLTPQAQRLLEVNLNRVGEAKRLSVANTALIDVAKSVIPKEDKEAYLGISALNQAKFNIPTPQLAEQLFRLYPTKDLSEKLGATLRDSQGRVVRQDAVPQLTTAENLDEATRKAIVLRRGDIGKYIETKNRIITRDRNLTLGEIEDFVKEESLIREQAAFTTGQGVVGMERLFESGIDPRDLPGLTLAPGTQSKQESRPTTPSPRTSQGNGIQKTGPVEIVFKQRAVTQDGQEVLIEGATADVLAENISIAAKEGIKPVGKPFKGARESRLEDIRAAQEGTVPKTGNPNLDAQRGRIALQGEQAREIKKQTNRAERETGVASESQVRWRFNRTTGEIERPPTGSSMSELKNYASAAQPQAVQKLDAYTNFRTQGKNYLETLQNLSKEDRNPDFLKTLSVALDRFLATGVQIPMTNIYVLRGGTQVMSPQQRALYEAAILFSQTFEPYFLGESKDSSELKAIKNLFRGALSDPMKQEDSVKRFLDLAARKMEDYTSGFPGAVYGNRKKLEFSPTKESVLPPGPSTPVPRDFNPTKESVLPPGPSTRVPVENSILDFILRSYTFSRGRSNSSK